MHTHIYIYVCIDSGSPQLLFIFPKASGGHKRKLQVTVIPMSSRSVSCNLFVKICYSRELTSMLCKASSHWRVYCMWKWTGKHRATTSFWRATAFQLSQNILRMSLSNKKNKADDNEILETFFRVFFYRYQSSRGNWKYREQDCLNLFLFVF